MLIRPVQLGGQQIDADELERDLKNCAKFGPCGVGKTAFYLSSFYIDRRYYIPAAAVRRVYKRVAVSKGGFTGRGLFASLPYLVVEYINADGKTAEKTCNFKVEDQVDQMLEYIRRMFPGIPTHSMQAEARLREKEAAARARINKIARSRESGSNAEIIEKLESGIALLEERPDLYTELSLAARMKRTYEKSNPAYKWVALVIVIMGVIAAAYGAYSLVTHTGSGLYFMLFGLAAIFMFSGANVMPTAKNNRKAVDKRLADAEAAMEGYLASRGAEGRLPVPARYAHPNTLRRMELIIADNRAETADEAFGILKDDLKELNSDVEVEQEEYDEIMSIKPMFLVHDYM